MKMKGRKATDHRPAERVAGFAKLDRDGDKVSLAVKFTDLRDPEWTYESDGESVFRRGGAVSLVFEQAPYAQAERVASRLVEVRMPFESFLGFWMTTQQAPFKEKLQTWLKTSAALDDPQPQRTPAPQTENHALCRAQLGKVSHVGSDAEICFYAVSAFAMSLAVTDRNITRVPVTGVVRVTCTTHSLGRLLSNCEAIAAEVKELLLPTERDKA